MSNEVRGKNEQLPTVPAGRNVFECAGDAMTQGSVIVGDLLKFAKGDWVAGRDSEKIADGTELVAVVPGIIHGQVRWEDNRPVDHQNMGLLIDGFVPPHRSTLGYDDQSKWEIKGGEPSDRWSPTIYMPMTTIDATRVFTFTTSSDGGKRHAIGPLSKEYGARIRQHPDELPIIKLGQDKYRHSEPSIGWVKYPLMPPVRWVKADKYLAAVAAVAGRSLKLLGSV